MFGSKACDIVKLEQSIVRMSMCFVVVSSRKTTNILSVWGQLNFMLWSKIEACTPPRNGLKSCQRHRNDLSV